MLLKIWLYIGSLSANPLLDSSKNIIWLSLKDVLDKGLNIWINFIVHVVHKLLPLLITVQLKVLQQVLDQSLLVLDRSISIDGI